MTLPPTQRRREATLSSTGVMYISMLTPAQKLSLGGNSRIEESPALLKETRSRAHAVCRGESNFNERGPLNLTHIPRASFCSWGSDHHGHCLQPPPNSHCTQPLWPVLQVVTPWGGGPHYLFSSDNLCEFMRAAASLDIFILAFHENINV